MRNKGFFVARLRKQIIAQERLITYYEEHLKDNPLLEVAIRASQENIKRLQKEIEDDSK